VTAADLETGPGTVRRVRRAFGVTAAFDGNRLELRTPMSGRCIPATDLILDTIGECETWQPADGLALDQGGVEYLVRVGLLVEEGTPAADQDDTLRTWQPWGTEAVAYQFHSRRQFVDYPPAETTPEALAWITGPQPPLTKSCPMTERIVLPPVSPVSADFEATLRRRRTWREFGPTRVPLESLATLLGLTFGATGRRDGPFGSTLIRTSPSAGGRHPVEAYVCVMNVADIDPAAYHYAVLDHALERIDTEMPVGQIVGFMADRWAVNAGVVCFLTGVVARSRWKYPFGRMYRTMLLDVGHIAQTFVLTATALGLAAFQTAAFQDPPIEEALHLDPALEPVLHAVGAGRLPD
jgi:SagB-type dehydrogenase family enzyme